MKSLALAACVSVLSLACEQSVPPGLPTAPGTRAPAPTPPPMAPSSVFPIDLGGSYRLTIEFPAACGGIPELVRPRRYSARLEIPAHGPRSFAGIWISGGGYAAETLAGSIYARGGDAALLSWNNFDPWCDGELEPLSGGRRMMVCGDGPATYDASAIGAEIAGTVFMTEDGVREQACRGVHRLAFERVGP